MKYMSERCVVCKRVTEICSKMPLCNLHMRAYNSILDRYVDWKNAYEDLSPREFLKRLVDNEYSGRWVKEVARIILSREELMKIFLKDLSCQGTRD